MSVLLPAALAFAIIIPIILLFYFMRPRRQERVVSSTLLWQQALQDTQASRPWQRLRITPLLLLQLLAAIVVVLVLMRPAILLPNPISGDTIIILQSSASMQATDVAPSRFEAARSRIADLIDGLGPGDHVSLIAMARTPQVVIADSSDKNQLSAALASIKVTNQDADLETALSLASALAAGHSDAKALVVGDGHVLPPAQELAVPMPVYYLDDWRKRPECRSARPRSALHFGQSRGPGPGRQLQPADALHTCRAVRGWHACRRTDRHSWRWRERHDPVGATAAGNALPACAHPGARCFAG